MEPKSDHFGTPSSNFLFSISPQKCPNLFLVNMIDMENLTKFTKYHFFTFFLFFFTWISQMSKFSILTFRISNHGNDQSWIWKHHLHRKHQYSEPYTFPDLKEVCTMRFSGFCGQKFRESPDFGKPTKVGNPKTFF